MSMDPLLSRITLDPTICHGKPCVRGLRYPVEVLLELLSSGMTFEEILADDFMSSYPDGSLHDKAEFLELTAQPVTFSELVAEDVRIRLLGDFAIIHGRFNSRSADGKPRRGRYTDNWARRDGTWVAVSAHFNFDQDG